MTNQSGTVVGRHDLAYISFDIILHIEPHGKYGHTQMDTCVRNPALVDMERSKKPFWGRGGKEHFADDGMEGL